jgi:hypothetical protein
VNVSCSYGSATYQIAIAGSAGAGFAFSMDGVSYSGRVSGKQIAFSGQKLFNSLKYQGSIASPTSMGGTYTQSVGGETCRWSASRIGAPPPAAVAARPKEPRDAAPPRKTFNAPPSNTAKVSLSTDWTRCVNTEKTYAPDIAIGACRALFDGGRETV